MFYIRCRKGKETEATQSGNSKKLSDSDFLHADCKVVKLPHYARISGSDAKKVKGKLKSTLEPRDKFF